MLSVSPANETSTVTVPLVEAPADSLATSSPGDDSLRLASCAPCVMEYVVRSSVVNQRSSPHSKPTRTVSCTLCPRPIGTRLASSDALAMRRSSPLEGPSVIDVAAGMATSTRPAPTASGGDAAHAGAHSADSSAPHAAAAPTGTVATQWSASAEVTFRFSGDSGKSVTPADALSGRGPRIPSLNTG